MATAINTRPSPDAEIYSSLEVDTRSQATPKYRLPDRNAFPEVYDHGLPQIATSKHNFPQVAAHKDDLPEVVFYNDDATPADPRTRRAQTVCGIRRKVFWIMLVITLAVIIGAAVGGGVAGSMRKKEPEAPKLRLLPNTKLASMNFTDQYGYENYFVYYQLTTRALYQSHWNSSDSEKTWVVSPVKDTGVRAGTPLSANIFYWNETSRNMHLYMINDNRDVEGQIHGQGQPRGLSDWQTMASQRLPSISNASRILSYGRENHNSSTQNIVVSQTSSGTLQLSTKSGQWSWESVGIGNIDNPVLGAGMALVPILADKDTNKSLAVFYNTMETDSLKYVSIFEKGDNRTKYHGGLGANNVNYTASIAAFSSGFSLTGEIGTDSGDGLNVHVLAAEPGKPVRLTAFRHGQWGDRGPIIAMADEIPLNIAANQAGRVYGTVMDSNGTTKIVEWEWVQDNEYKRVGEVKTPTKEE